MLPLSVIRQLGSLPEPLLAPIVPAYKWKHALVLQIVLKEVLLEHEGLVAKPALECFLPLMDL